MLEPGGATPRTPNPQREWGPGQEWEAGPQCKADPGVIPRKPGGGWRGWVGPPAGGGTTRLPWISLASHWWSSTDKSGTGADPEGSEGTGGSPGSAEVKSPWPKPAPRGRVETWGKPSSLVGWGTPARGKPANPKPTIGRGSRRAPYPGTPIGSPGLEAWRPWVAMAATFC